MKMKTEIIKIDRNNCETDKLRYAAEIMRNGGTVVFPTETVYGLGACALSQEAVGKIFEAKGRPADNPLIVHIAYGHGENHKGGGMLETLTDNVSSDAKKLMEAFWPGPLTIIFRKSAAVPSIVTAGLDTVAVRMPSHPVALALITMAGVPIAAPSANSSGKPSPTSVKHVIDDLMGRVDVIIDAGDTDIGLESTVLDISAAPPAILRPGGVTIEEVRKVLRDVQYKEEIFIPEGESAAPRSPGMKYTHYSPKAQVVVVEGDMKKVVEKIRELYEAQAGNGLKVGILATTQTQSRYEGELVATVGDRDNPHSIASNLFRALREFDEKGADIILAEGISEEGIGAAVMNRLRKAAGPGNIIKV